MKHFLLIAGVVLALSACATTEPRVVTKTVTVEVPVYQPVTPPDWLLEPVIDPASLGDVFVAPDDPDIVLGVTREGLKEFWRLIDRPLGRIEAWEAWAMAPAEGVEHAD